MRSHSSPPASLAPLTPSQLRLLVTGARSVPRQCPVFSRCYWGFHSSSLQQGSRAPVPHAGVLLPEGPADPPKELGQRGVTASQTAHPPAPRRVSSKCSCYALHLCGVCNEKILLPEHMDPAARLCRICLLSFPLNSGWSLVLEEDAVGHHKKQVAWPMVLGL